MDTQASEIMCKEIITATETMTVEDAVKSLINGRITGMPVVDAHGKVIGILSDYDILLQIAAAKSSKGDTLKKTISFSRKVECIYEDTPLKDIIIKLLELKYRRLPVVDTKGKLKGIITRRDLMKIFHYRATMR